MAVSVPAYFGYCYGISEDSVSRAVINVALRDWINTIRHFHARMDSLSNTLRYACTRLDTLTAVHKSLLEQLKHTIGPLSAAHVMSAELLEYVVSECEDLICEDASLEDIYGRMFAYRDKLGSILEHVSGIQQAWCTAVNTYPQENYPKLHDMVYAVASSIDKVLLVASEDVDAFLGGIRNAQRLSEADIYQS